MISCWNVTDSFELIFGQIDLKVVHFKLLSLGSEIDLLHEFFVHFLMSSNFPKGLALPWEITLQISEIFAHFLCSTNYEN